MGGNQRNKKKKRHYGYPTDALEPHQKHLQKHKKPHQKKPHKKQQTNCQHQNRHPLSENQNGAEPKKNAQAHHTKAAASASALLPLPFEKEDGNNKNNNDNVLHDSSTSPKGVYAVYKRATLAFRDGFAAMLPKKGFPLETVADFRRGAAFIAQRTNLAAKEMTTVAQKQQQSQEQPKQQGNRSCHCTTQNAVWAKMKLVDQAVLDNLNTSIQFRQQQAHKYRDNHRGHRFIINVLEFCRSVLLFHNQVASSILRAKNKHRETTVTSMGIHKQESSPSVPTLAKSPFDVDGEGESESERSAFQRRSDGDNVSNNDIHESQQHNTVQAKSPTLHTPFIPSASTLSDFRYDNDESLMIDVDDDRFQFTAFFDTMDTLLQSVRKRFDRVKELCILANSHGASTNKDMEESRKEQEEEILFSLMEAAIATNTCFQCVQSTWAALTLEHCHIRSIYDLLVVVFLLPKLSKDDKHKDVLDYVHPRHPHAVHHLMGDVVAACFSAEEGMLDFSKPLMEYSSKLCLPDGGWEKELLLADARELVQDVRCMVLQDESKNGGSHQISQSLLSEYKFIGGSRCLLNTQKVVQQTISFYSRADGSVDDARFSLAKAACNSFPFDWDENKSHAKAIRGDLDRLLSGEILPELLATCLHQNPKGHLSGSSGVKHLLPVLKALDEHLRSAESLAECPIPIPLAFGIHAILISLESLQGNDHVMRVSLAARRCYEIAFDNLKASSKSFSPYDDNAELKNWDMISSVGKSTWSAVSSSSILRAHWNPYMAGCFSLYSCYHGGVKYSTSYLQNIQGVLHMYNALRSDKQVGSIAILDRAATLMQSYMWTAGKSPSLRGEFAKAYVSQLGSSVRGVAAFLTDLKRSKGIYSNHCWYANDRNREYAFSSRKTTLKPEDYSFGYAALFHHSFGTEETVETCNSLLSDEERMTECEVFIDRTCTAFRKDIRGGGFINLVAVGEVIYKFRQHIFGFNTEFCSVVDVLGSLDFACHGRKPEKVKQIAFAMEEHFMNKTVPHLWREKVQSNNIEEQ